MNQPFLSGRLTRYSLLLTACYFALWALGPLLLSDVSANRYLGLPFWFWLSCIAAPVALIASAYWFLIKKNTHE